MIRKAVLFFMVSVFWAFSIQGAIPAVERAALIALYNATNGDNWLHNDGWKGNNNEPDGFSQIGSEDSWTGIVVSGDTVARIYLTCNFLRNNIPPEIGDLTNLTVLYLDDNFLSGNLPPELGNLVYLQRLDLSYNSFDGNIPPEFGNLINLTSLKIFSCQLSGSLPPELANLTGLQELILIGNNLTGNLPPEWANLSNLENLSLSSNDLSGSLPPEWANLTSLQNLSLSYNDLSGGLPPEWANFANLEYLYLGHNNLSGSIPPEWLDHAPMQGLILPYNNLSGNLPVGWSNPDNLLDIDLSGNNFSGSLPMEWANFKNLRGLSLSDNDLSGNLPVEWANLDNLESLDLGDNNLSGSLPLEWANLKNIRYLYLDNNNLSGVLPPEWANLDHLITLNLSGNELSGNLPAEWGNFEPLGNLYLDDNNLSGSLPPEWGNRSAPSRIGLSDNNLSGSIPPEWGNNDSLFILRLSGNSISGTIPPELGKLTNLWQLHLQNNELTGSIPKELGNLTFLCYGGELWLNDNRLTGTIPPELVDAAPDSLLLHGNRLSGPIPDRFLEYPNFDIISLGYNELYTNNPALIAFLDSYSPGWSDTQTVAPKDVAAAPVSATSIKVSWTPIVYTEDSGGYKVLYSTTSGEPYIEAGITSGKSVSEFVVTGLQPGTTYYFVVRTQTDPHIHNKNTLLSPYSAEVSAVTLVSNSFIIEPTALNFESFVGTSEPQTQTFTISYGGSGPYGWSASCDEEWLSVNPASGTGAAVVTVSVDPSGLALGTYSGTVTVSDPNVVNSPQTVSVYLEIKEAPIMILNRNQLYFGAIIGSTTPPPQSFAVSYSATGTFNWNASSSASWLSVNPSSGTGASVVTVSVDPSGLAIGTYSGTITLSDTHAANSPLFVSVQLIVKEAAQNQAPFGSFDTPISGTTVSGSIPVTGWALDDTAVESVKIYRAPVSGESGGLVYIGDAVFVEGARPDIEQAYPGYPMNYRAGWGYMMLTNFLPDGGNGTFTLYAYARDPEGNKTTLGQKTIVCNNADAVKPFGAIDTPGQGGSASGSSFVNFGWALTPQPNTIPFDGSTISVIIDGVNVGHPVYNNYREDIATLFPDYANSNGAVGYFYIDTTKYADGVHTISWIVTDDAGNADGIGSRYFNIYNGTSDQFSAGFLKGYDLDGEPKIFYPDDADNMTIEIAQLERIVVDVGVRNIAHVPSFNLPVGSTLDMERGIFYWQPGPGFIGFYRFEFIGKDKKNRSCRRTLNINISPNFEK